MLILASSSVTRKNLLAGAGIRFSTAVAGIDERAVENLVIAEGGPPEEIARRLAVAKAEAVASRFPEAVIIGADQVLTLGRERFHKPPDLAAAREQLSLLRGRRHRLESGVAIVAQGRLAWSHVATAALTMRPFSDAERDAVLAEEGADVLGSVGGYRLEGPSIRLFEAIEGDYFAMLGLPLLPLLAALRVHALRLFEESIR